MVGALRGRAQTRAKGRRWLWVLGVLAVVLLQIVALALLDFLPHFQAVPSDADPYQKDRDSTELELPTADAKIMQKTTQMDADTQSPQVQADSIQADLEEQSFDAVFEGDESQQSDSTADQQLPIDPLEEQEESMTEQEAVLESSVDDPAISSLVLGPDGQTVGDTSLLVPPPCDGTDMDIHAIEIHVIGFRRPLSLFVLLQQLKNSPHGGWDKPITLHIHVDGGADGLVVNTILGFKWPFGDIKLDIRTTNIGLREMWLSSLDKAARAIGPNGLMIVFEDDMRISPLYFQWLLRILRKYGRNLGCRDKDLMGISLSPIRIQEMHKPFTRYHAHYSLPERCKAHSTYLATLPSSWGSAYFTDRWVEFIDFTRLRMQPPWFDTSQEALAKTVKSYDDFRLTPLELYIPGNCRSNVWPHSWKRFMVDFMFGRGLVMLYPNLPGEVGLATTLQLSGKHVDRNQAKGKDRDDEIDEVGDSRVRTPRERDLNRNARVAALLEGRRGIMKDLNLPKTEQLCVRDLFLQPTSRDKAVSVGAKFLAAVLQGNLSNEALVRAWARPQRKPSGR